jgi:hypothetical protein
MKRCILVLILLLAVTVSCMSTPQQQADVEARETATPPIVAAVQASATILAPTTAPAPSQTPSSMAMPTSTPSVPPATRTPEPTATITNTPEPTYELTNLVSSEWGSYKSGERAGRVDPEQMYPLVGAVNHANRFVFPTGEVDRVKVAAYTAGVDLTTLNRDAYAKQKSENLSALRTDPQLKAIWPKLIRALKSADQLGDKTTVIWDLGTKTVRMVVIQKGDSFSRYSVVDSPSGLGLQEMKDYNLLPQLKVEGPCVVRTDKVLAGEDRRVQLKGANITNFDSKDQQPRFSASKGYIDTAKRRGSNLLRFQLNITTMESAGVADELQEAIDYAEQLGMYSILSPANVVRDEGIELPSKKLGNFLGNLAEKYKGKNNVTYSLLNEIQDPTVWDRTLVETSWSKTVAEMNRLGNIVLSRNPNAVLVIPGRGYNKDFSYIIEHPASIPFKNAIFDIHHYLKVSLDTGEDITWIDSFWEGLIGTRPVIFGEAGAPGHLGGRNNPKDRVRIQEIIDIVNSHPYMAHYAAFAFTPGTWSTTAIDASSNPNSRGKPYYDDMTNPSSPSRQTYFTK